MILSIGRIIQVLSLIAEKGLEEAAAYCDVPEATLALAAQGRDIPTWQGHNITESLDTWEAYDAD